jgi:hypothetical protein
MTAQDLGRGLGHERRQKVRADADGLEEARDDVCQLAGAGLKSLATAQGAESSM